MMQLLALEHFSSNAQAFSMRIWGQLAMSIDRKLMRSAATSAAGTGLEEGLGGGGPLRTFCKRVTALQRQSSTMAWTLACSIGSLKRA